jgi:hypothetical protein
VANGDDRAAATKGVRLCGLWKNKQTNGRAYASGSCGLARIVLFENDRKIGTDEPDYHVYIYPNEQRPSGDKPQGGQGSGS